VAPSTTCASYTPHEGEPGRQCLNQCLSTRQLCRQTASMQVQQCRLNVQQEAQTENLRLTSEYQIELQRYQAGLRKNEPDRPSLASPSYWLCDNQAENLEQQCAKDYHEARMIAE
jgi:hypothetical protein